MLLMAILLDASFVKLLLKQQLITLIGQKFNIVTLLLFYYKKLARKFIMQLYLITNRIFVRNSILHNTVK